MKKPIFCAILSCILLLSAGGCSEKSPPPQNINGSVTASPTPPVSSTPKRATFTTTDISGADVSESILDGSIRLAFFNASADGVKANLDILNNAFDGGAMIIGVVRDEDLEAAKLLLADYAFPIIVYNESMKTAFAEYDASISGSDYAAIWSNDGNFAGAWETSESDFEQLVRDYEKVKQSYINAQKAAVKAANDKAQSNNIGNPGVSSGSTSGGSEVSITPAKPMPIG